MLRERVAGGCCGSKLSRVYRPLEEGDEVMADRGFDIRDILADHGVKVTIPNFKKHGRPQLKEGEGNRSEKIEEARIHVEELFRELRHIAF